MTGWFLANQLGSHSVGYKKIGHLGCYVLLDEAASAGRHEVG